MRLIQPLRGNAVSLGLFFLAAGALAGGCGSTGPATTNNRPSSSASATDPKTEETVPADSGATGPDEAETDADATEPRAAEPVKVLRPSEVREQIEEVAQDWYGVPYQWGGESKNGIDCSAFVQRVYRQAFSYRLPRVTETQVQTGGKVPRSKVRAGDLVFFRPENEWNHVGVYLGNGTFAHASSSDGVTKDQFGAPYWNRYYWTARRPLKPSVLPDSLTSELVAYRYPDSTAQSDSTGDPSKTQQEGTITIASCSNPDVECASPNTSTTGRTSSGKKTVAAADTTTRKGW